jgi:hypothetical protein
MSLQRVSELSFIDNLFMAFSAVCVTGLTTTSLAETYTDFGQLVVCLRVQVGGRHVAPPFYGKSLAESGFRRFELNVSVGSTGILRSPA